MPPRKTTTQPTEHVCTQSEAIGGLKVAIDTQNATDIRIEQSLKELVEKRERDKNAIHDQFSALSNQISKMVVAMESSNTTTNSLVAKHDDILEEFRRQGQQNTMLKQVQDLMLEEMKEHFSHSGEKFGAMEARIAKLERIKWFWCTLAVGIGSVLAIVASVTNILYRIMPK